MNDPQIAQISQMGTMNDPQIEQMAQKGAELIFSVSKEILVKGTSGNLIYPGEAFAWRIHEACGGA